MKYFLLMCNVFHITYYFYLNIKQFQLLRSNRIANIQNVRVILYNSNEFKKTLITVNKEECDNPNADVIA